MNALAGTPPESVESGDDSPFQASRNRVGSWNVPVDVNGVSGQWIFDPGADQSTLTEGEAKRMGLSIRDTKVYVSGSTGKKNALQLPVASDVRIGGAHIHNVVFLVLSDQALHIAPLHYQITGILGLPALRALGRVEISSTGATRIRARGNPPEGTPNLFFDDAVVYPSALNAIGREERLKLRTKREKIGGAGGVITRRTQLIPALEIEVLGRRLTLKKLSLLSETPPGNGRYRDGVIGMDALWSGFILDFDAMRLQVQ